MNLKVSILLAVFVPQPIPGKLETSLPVLIILNEVRPVHPLMSISCLLKSNSACVVTWQQNLSTSSWKAYEH